MKYKSTQNLSWALITLSAFALNVSAVAQPAKSNKTAQVKVKKSLKKNTDKASQIKVDKPKVSAEKKETQIKVTKQETVSKPKESQLKASKDSSDPKNSQLTSIKTGKAPKDSTSHNKASDKKTDSATKNEVVVQIDQAKKSQRVRARRLGRLHERDSAFAPRIGSWSIGIFNPLKIQINDEIGIETHPLVALIIAPNLKVWQRVWSKNNMRLQGMYGLSTPSWSLQRNIPFGLASYLSSSCQVNEAEPNRAPESCQRPGFDFVPQLGARLSGEQGKGIWSLEADLAYGFMINGSRPTPLDSYAPIEIAYAPSTQHYRAHLGMKYSQLLHPRLAISLAADLYLTGQADPAIMPEKEPLSVSSQLSFDWATSRHTSLTFGAIMWVSDQRAFELIEDEQGFVKKESVMSFDIFPTLDFLWHY